MCESESEGNATPKGLVSSVFRALSATMGSGGNRNSRMTVAASNDSHRGHEQFRSDDLEERSAEIRYAEQHAWRNLGSTDSLPTSYADIRAFRDETPSLMPALLASEPFG